MKIRVDTPTPRFLNDMLDIVRIFFGNTETDPGAPVILSHAEEVCEGQRRVRVTLTKDRVFDSESVSPVFQDPLEEKRMHKRQLKRCVYDVCRQATGRASISTFVLCLIRVNLRPVRSGGRDIGTR